MIRHFLHHRAVIDIPCRQGRDPEQAARIIFLHNHPAGDPEPSSEDRSIRERLTEAGELLAIPGLNFLIIGEDGRYWSPEGGVCQIPLPESPGENQ